MNYTEVLQTLISSIMESVKSMISIAPCDHSFKARITEAAGSKKYKVIHSGKTYTVSSSVDYKAGDYVWVCAPCNNWNNLFIVCKS